MSQLFKERLVMKTILDGITKIYKTILDGITKIYRYIFHSQVHFITKWFSNFSNTCTGTFQIYIKTPVTFKINTFEWSIWFKTKFIYTLSTEQHKVKSRPSQILKSKENDRGKSVLVKFVDYYKKSFFR